LSVTEQPAQAQLRRTLSLWQVTASGVGIVIGAGIYVLIGEAAGEAGPALWISFVIAGALSAITALSYAELAGMYPNAGAEYEFTRRAFNETTGFLTGWMMVVALVIAAAAVALGFAQYLRHFFDVDERVGALSLLAALTLLVAAGIQRSIWVSAALALLQVGGLLMVIVSGSPHIGDRPLVEGSTFAGVMSGAALVFFAFIGFDEVVTLSEETQDAERVVPRALLLALGISTALYVLVGLAAVSVVGADALANSDRPLALVMEHDWEGRASDIVAFIALASTTNTTLLVLTAASRNTFAMSRGGVLPPALATVGRHGGAPYVAAIAAFVVAAAFSLAGDLGLIASVTDLAVYAIFVAVNVSLIRLRYTRPDARRTFRVPLSVGKTPLPPIAGAVTAVVMLAYLEPAAWAIGAGALGLGILVWAAIGRRAHRTV
jgi:APA family basic amino acid/polyamine antiporter